jgi:transcription elongation GreA/GreB family factor
MRFRSNRESDLFMAKSTHQQLTVRVDSMKGELEQIGKEKGEAGGTSDWHDNAAFDELSRLYDLKQGEINQLKADLRRAQFISPPSRNADRVQIGHSVDTEIEQQRATYTILGRYEANPDVGVISHESPLAQNMLGKKRSETFPAFTETGSGEGRIIDFYPARF